MRQIKFRAFSTDTNEMIPWEEAMFPEWFEDDEMVVQQFTGFKDKNGKEIYEGDILEYTYRDVMEVEGYGKCNYRVDFQNGAFGWIGDITKGFFSFAQEPLDDTEVIGNIYEHPHLLNSTPNDELCDATDDASSTGDDK